MKKSKQSLIAAFVCIAAIATGQKIKWDKKFVDTTRSQVHEIIGSDNSGFFVTRYKDGLHLQVLEKYDFSGNKIFSKDLEFEEEVGKHDYLIDDIYFMKDNLVYTVCSYDAKTTYAFKIGFDGTVSKDKLNVGDIEVHKGWGMGSGKGELFDYRYNYSISADKTTLLCYYRKEDDNKMTVKAVKEDLTKLWDKNIDLPVQGKDLAIDDAVLSGDKAYFLVYALQDNEKDKYAYELIEYNHTTDKVTKIDMSLPTDRHFTESDIQTDKAGNVIINLVYESRPDDGLTGAYFVKIDNGSGNVSVSKDLPFDKSLLVKFVSAKKADKGYGIETLKIKKVLLQDDNSVIVALEQTNSAVYRNTTYERPTSSGMQSSSYRPVGSAGAGFHSVTTTMQSYDYNDGVIYKVNADGSMAWINDIAKTQDMSSASATAPVASSYSLSIFDNKLYLIFNDNKNNADVTAEDIEKDKSVLRTNHIDGGHSYQTLILETIDLKDGTIKRKKLDDFYKTGDLFFYANFYYQLADKTIVFCSTIFRARGKDDGQFGEFTITQ